MNIHQKYVFIYAEQKNYFECYSLPVKTIFFFQYSFSFYNFDFILVLIPSSASTVIHKLESSLINEIKKMPTSQKDLAAGRKLQNVFKPIRIHHVIKQMQHTT